MKTISPRLVAATALALMMTEAPGIALAAKGQSSALDQIIVGPAPQRQLLLAQADSTPEAAPDEATGDDQEPRRKKRADQEQEQETPAAQQEAPAQQEPERRAEPAPEPAPAPPAPAAPVEAAPAEQAQPAPEPAPAEPARESDKPAPEAVPAPAATEQEAGETRQQRRERERREAQEERQKQQQDAAPAEQANPAPEATPAPAATEQEAGETRQQRRERERREAQEQRQRQQQDAEKPADAAPAEKPAKNAQPDQPATSPQQPPVDQAQPPQQTLPGSGGTPILDSQKEQPRPADGSQQATQPAPVPAAPAGPPPTSDQDAQKETVKIEDIAPVTREEGRRIDRPRGERREERERRDGVDVLREIAGRVILDLGGRPTVESDDRSRLERGARDVYYEELSRGRTRETIVRPNGVQVVTVRDRYGEIIRRSRIMPDGREIVLSYVDEERRGPPRGEWRDPGYDLPPLVLNIPVDEYILDAERAESDDDYYDFLEQPPVERVERYYSIDEVKRSARVRDSVRRIDLDTITFDFGSADIREDAVQRLDNVARAMERMLDKNPAETFLIEGHTDAVGSDLANLALSDRRAEAVARALTEVFDIPPENLTTQGYGEQYLKVKTEAPEQANRRVAIRRITPLVTPVAEAR